MPAVQPPAWVGCSVVSVYLHSKRKTARAINTKLGTHIIYSSRSACIDPEVKRSRSRSYSYENCHSRIVAGDACCYGRVLLRPAWVCMSIQLPVFSRLSRVLGYILETRSREGREEEGKEGKEKKREGRK